MLNKKKFSTMGIGMFFIVLIAIFSCTLSVLSANADSLHGEFVSYDTATGEVTYYDVSGSEGLNVSDDMDGTDMQVAGGEDNYYNPSGE